MRNAVLMAREVATIDALSGGRLTLGVGVGWSEAEFSNLGLDAVFHRRGAYLDESIAVWRHLWSGSEEPFNGRFHSVRRLPPSRPCLRRARRCPIYRWRWFRGRPAARRRGSPTASTPRDGPASSTPERATAVREAALAAGRPEPAFSARVRVRFEPRMASGGTYAMTGTPDEMRCRRGRLREAGVSLLVLDLMETDPAAVVAALERFNRDIVDGPGP